MDGVRNQYTTWKDKDKCIKLRKKFGGYDDFENGNPNGNRIVENRFDLYRFVRSLLEKDSYSFLEVGPGPGHFLWAFRNHAAELYGLEYSEHMIELCKKQFRKSDKIVYLTQGTCWDLPYTDDSFDISFQCDVTRHIGGCWTSILEQVRVSKKYVIYSGPSFEKWGKNGPMERKLKKLTFGINEDLLNDQLNTLKSKEVISNYFYRERPNVKNSILNRKVLVIKINND